MKQMGKSDHESLNQNGNDKPPITPGTTHLGITKRPRSKYLSTKSPSTWGHVTLAITSKGAEAAYNKGAEAAYNSKSLNKGRGLATPHT